MRLYKVTSISHAKTATDQHSMCTLLQVSDRVYNLTTFVVASSPGPSLALSPGEGRPGGNVHAAAGISSYLQSNTILCSFVAASLVPGQGGAWGQGYVL